jgi:hypothetical protein
MSNLSPKTSLGNRFLTRNKLTHLSVIMARGRHRKYLFLLGDDVVRQRLEEALGTASKKLNEAYASVVCGTAVFSEVSVALLEARGSVCYAESLLRELEKRGLTMEGTVPRVVKTLTSTSETTET